MPSRYFTNRLPDYKGGPVTLDTSVALRAVRDVFNAILHSPARKPSVYTGAAGVAYALWYAYQQAPQLASIASEQQLLQGAEQFVQAALDAVADMPADRYGWSLLAGHAGVYGTGALVLGSAAQAAGQQGLQERAAGLSQRQQACVQRFAALQRLACSTLCQEDEILYGRAGYLLGCLLLNDRVAPGSVPEEAMLQVVRAIIASGRQQAASEGLPSPLCFLWPPGEDAAPYLGAAHGLMGRRQSAQEPGRRSPLYFRWHDKPYLGAAHGMLGILYVLLHVPELLAAVPGAQRDVEEALQYVLSLECDTDGQLGPGGHYPTQMGPWRDRQPLVHWCHGATGAVFLLCKAHEQLGDGGYLAAAERSGEAVWQRGLLKKGDGLCHGVSGSAYALLRLYKATRDDKWLHRAVAFAEFMSSAEFRSGARTPDHPSSLYEGSAGALCLWVDLLSRPLAARFPMFEP